jgi:hypothetical protein
MRGKVASLNASVAGSVFLFEAAAQRDLPEAVDTHTGEPESADDEPTLAVEVAAEPADAPAAEPADAPTAEPTAPVAAAPEPASPSSERATPAPATPEDDDLLPEVAPAPEPREPA